MTGEMLDGTAEGEVSAVWRCDTCSQAFRLNHRETIVHTACTGHQDFHIESFIIQGTGQGRITIIRKVTDDG